MIEEIDFNRTRFVKSPHLVLKKHGKDWLVYNSLFGHPNILNNQCIKVINIFRQPLNLTEVRKKYDIEELERWIKFFHKNYYLIPEHFDERVYLFNIAKKQAEKISSGSDVTSLGLVIDEACNFDCSYCISKKLIKASKRSLHKKHKMTWEVAKGAIDKFIDFCRKRNQKKIEIYFGGSEPLLNWSLVEKIINFCSIVYGQEFEFIFSTNTNSSLITQSRAKYLCQNKVIVTSSLDGPPDVNDKTRKFLSGDGTFDRIISGWDNLGRFGQNVEWFCLTLSDANIDKIDENFFDFIKDRGVTSCSFEPDIISLLHKPPDEVAKKLIQFKHLGEERNIIIGGFWDKPAKNMFEFDYTKKIFNCSAFTGRGISILPSGEIVPCCYSATKLGTINGLERIFQSKDFSSFILSRAIGNIETCKKCEIEGQCLGGCYITSEYAQCTGSDEGFRYRCETYKKTTNLLLEMAADQDKYST